MSRILLDNIAKVFDGKITAVSDFNLEVPEGCFMVIVGPSGCGKTTTLRLIAGLEQATSGDIYIGQNLVNNISARERDVAMVFQNYILYPHMSAYQNMAFALKMRKLPKKQINERVEKTAKLLGIENLLRRKPHALSGGQRQRVALGKAIVRQPSAFLFDEPLSNLDAKMRLTMRNELKALHQKLKVTTIYVTHDQAEAMTLGEQICVMNNGSIQQIAGPMEIYEKPINKFVAGFFGTPGMNFFKGRIEKTNENMCFVMPHNTIELPGTLDAHLSNYHKKEMILGIRPESISLNPFANQNNNIITAKVDIIEPVGNRTDVFLSDLDGKQFIMSATSFTNEKANQSVKVYIDLNKIHIFEPDDSCRNTLYFNT